MKIINGRVLNDNQIVNEGTTFEITLSIIGIDGNPISPSSAQYRIIDDFSGQIVRDWTSISGSTEMTIILKDEDVAVIEGNPGEIDVRVLLFHAEYGDNKTINTEIVYGVKALKHL